MRKVFIILIVCLFFSAQVFAHPARQIDLSVNDKTLNIKVAHMVNDPQDHYIKQIIVYSNKKSIIQQTFSAQISSTEQVATYTIPSLKVGDTIVVETNCNKGGSRKESIIIE